MYNKKGKAAGRLAKINKYWVWVRPAEQQLLQRDFTSPHSPETALKDDWWYKMATKKKKSIKYSCQGYIWRHTVLWFRALCIVDIRDVYITLISSTLTVRVTFTAGTTSFKTHRMFFCLQGSIDQYWTWDRRSAGSWELLSTLLNRHHPNETENIQFSARFSDFLPVKKNVTLNEIRISLVWTLLFLDFLTRKF